MQLEKIKAPVQRVYVNLKDGRDRRNTQSMTIYGATVQQVANAIRKAATKKGGTRERH